MSDCSAAIKELETRRNALAAELAGTSTKTGTAPMLPNRVSEGVDVDWVEYRKSLPGEIKQLTETINLLRESCEGPVIEVSYG